MESVALRRPVNGQQATPFFYGGQAVLEGVMMRGQRSVAVATRHPTLGLSLSREVSIPWVQRARALRWPLVRGFVAMIEALVIGYRALNESAARLMADEAQPERAETPRWYLVVQLGSVVLALALTVGLFVALPAAVVRWLGPTIGSGVGLNLVEGLVKATIFVGYVAAIGLMPDMARVFQYHGAEHKAINCYEAGWPLEVFHARQASRIHTRCGTNFLFLVVLTSVVVFSLLTAFGRPPLLMRILIHLAILPLVAGIAYEWIRAAARPNAPRLVRLLVGPGLWLQRLTTREPDAAQLEVALAALQAVLQMDGRAPASGDAAASGDASGSGVADTSTCTEVPVA